MQLRALQSQATPAREHLPWQRSLPPAAKLYGVHKNSPPPPKLNSSSQPLLQPQGGKKGGGQRATFLPLPPRSSLALKRPRREGIVLYLGSSQSVWVGGQCYNPLPSVSRAETGTAADPGDDPRLERAAGQKGTPESLDLQETAWKGGLRRSPPTAGFFGFLWTLHALGKCRGGEQVPVGGLSRRQPPRTQGISLHMPLGTFAPLPFQ